MPVLVKRLEAPVLRHPALGDIEVSQHLDARDRMLGECAVRNRLDLRQQPIKAKLDRQAACQGFEMDVTRPALDRITQGRAHQAHRLRVFLPDRRHVERFDVLRLVDRKNRRCAHRIERRDAALQPGQIGGKIVRVHQMQGMRVRCKAQADPRQQGLIAWIIKQHFDHTIRTAHRHAAAPRAFDKRQQFKIGDGGLCFSQRARRIAELMSQLRQRLHRRLRRGGAHPMPPASSKIGMYMITTTAPMTRPITAITIGSNTLVNDSIQRINSSA